jgi:flagellin
VTARWTRRCPATSRDAINEDYKALLRQIQQTIENAEFDGANLLDGVLTSPIKFLSNADADSYVTLTPRNLSLGGGVITVTAGTSVATFTAASALMAKSTRPRTT